MWDLAETARFFDEHFTRTAFRLETLDCYDAGSDGEDVARYLRGEPGPSLERKQPWLDRLTAERKAGKRRHRVHVLTTPLSDYLRYECEWGYLPNAKAGEEIRILDLSETPRPEGLVDEDFWLLDDAFTIRMRYNAVGQFAGAELAADTALYRRARETALAASEEFMTWWARHPNEWRAHRVVPRPSRPA